jgi:hypothetical protein
MSVPINNQIAFYDWQLREMDLLWAKYHRANILDLYASNTLFIGRVWGYDDKRGVLILRFKKGKFPRLKEPLTLSYLKSSIGPLSGWDFSYGQFREKFVENYSNCSPIFYLPNDYNDDYRYVGVKNVSLSFLEHLKKDLQEKTHPIIVLGAEDPPREYLVALRSFTKNNPLNEVLLLPSSSIDSWSPKNMEDSNSLSNDTIDILKYSSETIIQGPPGTGKTYLIAEVCDNYLNNNKRVCVAALTHKALMEAAIKDGLAEKVNSGKVHKTNMSADESILIPKLQSHDVSIPIPKGDLLFSTYYSLSKLLLNNDGHVHFDLLIIEEASQAFLTTIAGFSSLADKVLVVGDFMQLQPIVLEEKRAINIDKNIFTLINGLRTYSVNREENSYRLVNTYRLTGRSAVQTGIFYDNSLKSLSSEKGIFLKGAYSGMFCPNGGTSLFYLDNMDEGKTPNNAINLIIKIVKDIQEQYPGLDIAVLAAFRDTVNSLVDRMLNVKMSFNNLEVNTVDRIQGMTVDVCIYLAPSSKSKFSFGDNRFNVATSRAKKGTLIITEDLVSNHKLLSSKVMSYFKGSYEAKMTN